MITVLGWPRYTWFTIRETTTHWREQRAESWKANIANQRKWRKFSRFREPMYRLQRRFQKHFYLSVDSKLSSPTLISLRVLISIIVNCCTKLCNSNFKFYLDEFSWIRKKFNLVYTFELKKEYKLGKEFNNLKCCKNSTLYYKEAKSRRHSKNLFYKLKFYIVGIFANFKKKN